MNIRDLNVYELIGFVRSQKKHIYEYKLLNFFSIRAVFLVNSFLIKNVHWTSLNLIASFAALLNVKRIFLSLELIIGSKICGRTGVVRVMGMNNNRSATRAGLVGYRTEFDF